MAQTYDIDIKLSVDSTELETASQELQNLENSATDATTSTDSLNDSVGSINGAGLEDASTGADDLAGSTDSADNSVQNLGANLDLINAGAFLAIAEEIGSLGAEAEAMAQEMNTAAISVGQLATNVGMAEPQMVGLINNISNATFPQNEAMAYVGALNQMGVSADKLGASATNMDRINDATGMGYTKVMQLTQGLQAVGVSADNLPSSFNAIAYAQANVNGGAETLSNVLKRQAATINEYGLNTDQLVLIMQKFSERGVQGMKMGSELANVLKETNGNTTELEKALGMTEGTLDNASSATGKYEGQLQKLADEEAEHKTILDQVGAAWEDMSLALEPIMAPLGSLAGILGGIGQAGLAVMGLSSLAETLGIAGVAAEGAGGAFAFLGVAELSALWPILAIIAAVAGLVVAFEAFGEWMGWWDSFGGMLESAQSAVMRLWDAFINHPDVQAIIEALSSAWDGFIGVIGTVQGWLGQLWDWIFPPSARESFDAVGLAIQMFGFAWDIISFPVKNTINTLTMLWDAFNTFYTMIQPVISFIASILVPIWNTLFSNLMIAVNGVNQLIEIFNLFMDGQITLLQAISMVWGTVQATFSGIINNIMGLVRSFGTRIVSQIRTIASNFVSSFISGIQNLGGQVYNSLIAGPFNSIVRWGSQMIDKVKEIASQVADGVRGIANQVTNAGSSGFSSGFSVGSSGFGGSSTLNSTLSNNITNTGATNLTVNNYMDGIMSPKHASDTIIGSLNDYTKKQNLIRGV